MTCPPKLLFQLRRDLCYGERPVKVLWRRADYPCYAAAAA